MKLGIDTGGTFTDFILLTSEGISTYKVSSTPDDPARAIVDGLCHFFPHPHSDKKFLLPHNLEVVHGTTVGTNAFLQRKGAKTLLVTTSGFEDVIFIGRQNRERLYDLDIVRSAEIISRQFSVGVKERVLFDGRIMTPLSKSVGKRLRQICRRFKIESVAVCLLHSYANPEHENMLAAELAPLGIPVSLSSEVLPEFREYERFSTTLINAYLAPVVSDYIASLLHNIGSSQNLSIQQSNGGVLPAESIEKRAVHTVLSGPAGGVQGAFHLACKVNLSRIITFDMGGTSTDVSLCDGLPILTRDYIIDSYPLRVQVMDIHTVGAGGGSLAHVDQAGFLHVGPQSAGADPGPVCYGKGDNITVTDANIFLGRLPAEHFLDGSMELFPDRVISRMKILSQKLNLTASETALGIIRLVNIGMVKAIRAVSLERGFDPKEFTLFSFGGASGLHCCELAVDLGIRKIVVPARAGILSAQGMVMADAKIDGSKALFLKGRELSISALDKAFSSLVATKKEEIESLCHAGSLHVERFVDLRYQGQSFEITVLYDDDFIYRFQQMHAQQFGYFLADSPFEVVSIRCVLTMKQPGEKILPTGIINTSRAVSIGQTEVLFESGIVSVDVYDRSHLHYGQIIKGPALIFDKYTTILLLRQFDLFVDSFLNLIIEAVGV